MAEFYATIQGNRGEASRMGSKASGIEGHIRGWNEGARVSCFVDDQGRQCVSIRLTGGSNGRKPGKCLGVWYRDEYGEYQQKGE